jgi:hypothetical protein
MARRRTGRIAAAVLAGYLLNAVLVAATELFLTRLVHGRSYFVADLATQCVYEVASGYLCCVIALPSDKRTATVSLILVGLTVGGFSLAASWNSEPRLYGIALIGIWAPFIWVGYLLARGKRAR